MTLDEKEYMHLFQSEVEARLDRLEKHEKTFCHTCGIENCTKVSWCHRADLDD